MAPPRELSTPCGHEYDIATQHLVVEETANFILITLDWPAEDLAALTEKTKQDQINRLAGLILKLNGTMVAPNLQDVPYHLGFSLASNYRRGYEILNRLRAGSIPNVVLGQPGRRWNFIRNHLYFSLLQETRIHLREKCSCLTASTGFDGRAWAGADRQR